MHSLIRRQRGVTLFVGMVMLIILTLMAIAALKLGKSNFLVVANQQTRAEAMRAVDQAIDAIIQNQEIQMTAGTNLFGTGTNQFGVDVNGDGNNDYTVTLSAPVCVKRAVLPQATLNFKLADDLGCARGVEQASLGVEGASAGDSLCSEVVWELSGNAVDVFRQNSVTVTQGIGQRIGTSIVSTVCD